MKRIILFSMFIACIATGYGQMSKTKQVTRIPVNNAAMQSSSKKDAHVIDGSQNVQMRSSVQSSNPYISSGGLQLPQKMNRASVSLVDKKLPEPQTAHIERERSQLRSSKGIKPEETTFAFFKETPQLKISNPEHQIQIDKIETDELNITNIKGTQLYRNVPVHGMNFTFHISTEKEWFMGNTVDSTYFNNLEVRFSSADAIRIAESDLSQTTEIFPPGEFMKNEMNYYGPEVKELYYPDNNNYFNYCYKVMIRPNIRDKMLYFIDAHSGEIVDKYNDTRFDGANKGTGKDLNGETQTVNTYLKGSTHYMQDATKKMYNASSGAGFIGVYDAKNDKKFNGTGNLCTNTSTTWNNPAAISAMYHLSIIYDYHLNTYNRNSFNNKGASLKAFINVCDPETGGGYDNAYWNGSLFAFGNGAVAFKPLAGGLDVIAHEFGHAVNDAYVNFEYKNQSGAIDEAYCDIFAVLIDRDNWTMGEKIIKSKAYFPTGFMRDMSNPHNGGKSINDDCWQPAHVSEMYLGTDDRGGVHINNSIPAHAFYTFAISTSREKAEKVFIRALSTYLRPTSKFIDLRKAAVQAAKDLNFTSDLQKLYDAFDKVGLIDDTVENKPPADLPTNPGGWGLLVCSTDENDKNSMYRTSDYKTFTPILTTAMKSTPSVTDDGKYAIFVDGNNNIIRLEMATGKQETFNSEKDNKSVAISRDGKRLAVISTYEDGRIWLYDFVSNKWAYCTLYNPTTGDKGAKSGGPRFADAIEFDHSGDYLIYDALNKSGTTIDGKDIEYWDIGLINVWDKSRNTWGTGDVVKLFTDLSPGVNVFNPVFSKNSPFIIAFDFYSNEDGNYTLGVNLSTGEIQGIISNNIPSYPSYSMDDKHIGFTTYNYSGDKALEVGYFELGSNKITATGDPKVIVKNKAFPLYYGTGTRVLDTKPVAAFSADEKSGGAPLIVKFVESSTGKPTSWKWTFDGGTPATSTQQHPEVIYTKPGTYTVTLIATNNAGSDELVKQGFITIKSSFKFGQRVVAGSSSGSSKGIIEDWKQSKEVDLQETVAVFPNPATDYIWIYGVAGETFDVKLFDLSGKSIPVKFVNEEEKISVDVSSLRQGIYLMRITLDDGSVVTKKMVKQ